jgi:hypothetical protein
VKQLFRELWSNDDDSRYRTARDVLRGRHAWLERGILGIRERPARPEEEASNVEEPAGVA